MKLFKNKKLNKVLLVLFLVIVICAVLLYIFRDSQIASSLRKFVGTTPTITADSIRNVDQDSIPDSHLGADFFKFKTKYDTLVPEGNERNKLTLDTIGALEIDSTLVDSTEVDSSSMGNTKNEKTSIVNTQEDKLALNKSNDLFDELMFSDQNIITSYKSKSFLSNNDIVSKKSMLKILAVCSKNILLKQNEEDNELIIRSLAESQSISTIIIADRDGQIKYATNTKFEGLSINNLYPGISKMSEGLHCFLDNQNDVCKLPIFHTYGKIGEGIVVYSTDN